MCIIILVFVVVVVVVVVVTTTIIIAIILVPLRPIWLPTLRLFYTHSVLKVKLIQFLAI
jgi:hypothetical protein